MSSQPVLSWPGGNRNETYLALGLETPILATAGDGSGDSADLVVIPPENYLLFVQRQKSLDGSPQLNMSGSLLSSSGDPFVAFDEPPGLFSSSSSSSSTNLRLLTVLLYREPAQLDSGSSFNWTAWAADLSYNPSFRSNFDAQGFAARSGLGQPVAEEVLIVEDQLATTSGDSADSSSESLVPVSTLLRSGHGRAPGETATRASYGAGATVSLGAGGFAGSSSGVAAAQAGSGMAGSGSGPEDDDQSDTSTGAGWTGTAFGTPTVQSAISTDGSSDVASTTDSAASTNGTVGETDQDVSDVDDDSDFCDDDGTGDTGTDSTASAVGSSNTSPSSSSSSSPSADTAATAAADGVSGSFTAGSDVDNSKSSGTAINASLPLRLARRTTTTTTAQPSPWTITINTRANRAGGGAAGRLATAAAGTAAAAATGAAGGAVLPAPVCSVAGLALCVSLLVKMMFV